MKKVIGGEDGEGGGVCIGSGWKDIVKLDEEWSHIACVDPYSPDL